MRTIVSMAAVCVVCLGLSFDNSASAAAGSSKLERGKYLVEQVGMCGDCHTPHNEKGEPIQEKTLQGTILPL